MGCTGTPWRSRTRIAVSGDAFAVPRLARGEREIIDDETERCGAYLLAGGDDRPCGSQHGLPGVLLAQIPEAPGTFTNSNGTRQQVPRDPKTAQIDERHARTHTQRRWQHGPRNAKGQVPGQRHTGADTDAASPRDGRVHTVGELARRLRPKTGAVPTGRGL